MLSHVTVGVSDFDRAMAFYTPLCAELGLRHRFTEDQDGRRWSGWMPAGADRPLFIVTTPLDGEQVTGNGNMVAFLAGTRGMVDRVHALALASGGIDAGLPGIRPEYHVDYYSAYFRDPDGNKLCIACHAPE